MDMSHVNWILLIGYAASLLVFSTFYMKTMIPLRCVAVASNIAFLTYGYLAGLYPVFLLHTVLLPLNMLRLYHKGDAADKLYYIARGAVCLPEIESLLGAGEILGEIGIFSPFKERTAS